MNRIEFLNNIIVQINDNYQNTYLNKIQEVSSCDFIFTFSKNKDNSLFISLSPQNPFLIIMNKKININLNSNFINQLKIKLLQGLFKEIKLLNNDSIIDIHFVKTTDTYQKIDYHLIIELFKGSPNMILLEENIIKLAFKYHSLDTHHPIILNTNYLLPNSIYFNKEINNEDELFKINDYLNDINIRYLSEKYKGLFSQLKRKRKTLERKLKLLNEEKNNALINLKYKEYGDYYLTIMEDIKKGEKFFFYNNEKVLLKENYSKNDNLTYLYKVYKKAKNTLKLNEELTNNTKNEIDYIDNILNSKNYLEDSDYNELINELEDKKLIKINKKINSNLKFKSISPYFFIYKDIKIGFGKTNYQNNVLTFKLANKNDYFFHIKDYPGSHLICFNEKLNDDLINICLESIFYLSNKSSIDVIVTKVKNVKKTSTIGLVNILQYETYHINKCRDEVIELIKTAKKFNF